jgi:uncharacterized protein
MSTIQKQIDLAAVLASIVTETGRIEGRVRLQKLCYLLQQISVPQLRDVWFRYHHYGPFSEDVAGVLQQAVFTHIIDEKIESFEDEWQRYEYTPGAKAKAYVAQLDSDSRRLIREVVDAVKDAHWRELELAATVDYLEKNEHLDSDEATIRAIKLKPACAGYKDDALALLSEIRKIGSAESQA